MKTKIITLVAIIMAALMLFCSCGNKINNVNSEIGNEIKDDAYIATVDDVPEFCGEPYVVIRDNEPDFKDTDMVTQSYEIYSELDFLGRCGVVMACVGTDIMPTEERGSIGQVKPTGWHTVKYDSVDGKYLYNRCHLMGYQLTGENANRQNLITGTRYLNVEGMLPFENMIADYVKETQNHVIYRVTPVFDGQNLLSRGVQLEAKSVEDMGEGICFNVYAYNNQPGIKINYSSGESRLKKDTQDEATGGAEYILNTNSKKFHRLDCESAEDIKAENRQISAEEREELIGKGYSPCKSCNP